MTQSAPRYTTAQILEAGRRAEAEGRDEYAIQFFRHLVDHNARAPEAKTAREALQRLEAARGRPANGQRRLAAVPAPTEAVPPPLPIAPNGTPPQVRLPGPHSLSPEPAPQRPAHSTPHAPPPAVRDYALGRGLARVVSAIGFMLSILGLAAVVLALVRPTILPELVIGNMEAAWMPIAGGITAVLGAVILFLGQLARAIFDGANATRELVTLARADRDRDTAN